METNSWSSSTLLEDRSRGALHDPHLAWTPQITSPDIFREIARASASVSVAEQHVEDVVALLAAGFGRSRSGEGRALGWRDAIPVDHPGTLLDAVGDQVLRLGGRSRTAIHDVAAGE